MATIVYQGLQSCLESQIVEARTLRLKLSSPKSVLSHSLELALQPNCSAGSSNGGWSFLQELSNSSNSTHVEKENVYVHPLTNRYSSKLSEKSLELCTESLGCETGSNISSENCFLFESSTSTSSSEGEEEEGDEGEEVSNSNSNSNSDLDQNQERQKPGRFSDRSFPPPLTTMSAAESVQFRQRREGGRLIITAVKAPAAVRGCFQAERADGRLRLSFAGHSDSDFDSGNEEEEMEEDCEIEEEEDTEGNNEIVGGEVGIEGFEMGRRRRCKEGEMEKNGLLNWETFWVAT